MGGKRKLTDEQVEEIRILREAGEKLWYLAELYNISESMVSLLCSKKRRASLLILRTGTYDRKDKNKSAT